MVTENSASSPCRCDGKTKLQYVTETTGGVVVDRVPVLTCQRCGEQWYPPGVPRLLEGLRETVGSLGEIRAIFNNKLKGKALSSIIEKSRSEEMH